MALKHLMNLALVCATTTLLNSQILYVKPNGTGDGSSWIQAMGDLRQALSTRTFYDQIWVAKGTYTPTRCTTCTVNDRKMAFEIPNGVDIYGGFEGTETQLSQRNWARNITILSGDIDDNNDTTNNSYNVIYLRNVGYETVIDGFTITHGNATFNDGAGERYTSGGAIFNDGRFTGGYANPLLRNCIFTKNNAKGFGGAVCNNASFNGYCEAYYKNCQFIDNTSTNGGGAVSNMGVFNSTNKSSFEFCRFITNFSSNSGAAVLNDAQEGRCENAFFHCQFIKNRTDLYGGAVYNLGKGGNCTPTVTNCLFWANKAFSAAAMYCLGSEQGNSNPRITNCIFYKNEARTGGSVYANAGEDTLGKPTGTAKPVISNTIIWGNAAPTGRVLRNINGTPILTNCIVDADSCGATHSGVGAGVSCIQGMIYNKDPLFVDADNGDFHLLPSSPAINAGHNLVITSQSVTLDLDSFPRIVGNTVDIGIYEFNPAIQFPPRILASPDNVTACAMAHVVLKTRVTGSLPLFFQWYKNGVVIPNETHDSLVFKNINALDTGIYTCIVKNEVNKTAITTDAVVKVKPILPLSISIAALYQPKCEGDTLTLKATYKNGGENPKLEWLMNGTKLTTGDTYTAPILSRWHNYTCRLTSSEQCATPNILVSNVLNFPIDTAAIAHITLTTSSKSICAGEKVTFKTTIDNGGMTPQYHWYLNGTLLNNTTPNYETTNLKDNDRIKAVMVSSQACVTNPSVFSKEDTITVKAQVNVQIAISADKTETCKGDTITLKANGTGGGLTPQYQWLINGVLASENSPVLKRTSFKNQDIIKAVLISSEKCTVLNPAISDSIKVFINEPSAPNIEINLSKSILCKGERVAFLASGKNLGTTPQYQWYLNNKKLDWSQVSYATDSLRIGDVVHATVKSSSSCVTTTQAISNLMIPRVRLCLAGQAYTDQRIIVYPNPTNDARVNVGLVNLKGAVRIELFTQRGQLLLIKNVENVQEDKEVNLEMSELANGLYIVRVTNGDFVSFQKWLVAR